MKEVFSYMFNDDNSLKKIGFFYGIIFVATVLMNCAAMYNPNNTMGEFSFLYFVFLFFGIIALFLPCGYGVLNVKNLIDKKEELPNFDFNKIFITGFKFLVSFFIFAGIVAMIFLLLGYLNAFLSNRNMSTFSFFVAVISFLISFIVLFILNASIYKFTKTNDIFAFIKLPDLFKSIDKNVNKYFFGFILTSILLAITVWLKNFLEIKLIFYSLVGLFIYSAVLSIVLAYVILVGAKIIAKTIEE